MPLLPYTGRPIAATLAEIGTSLRAARTAIFHYEGARNNGDSGSKHARTLRRELSIAAGLLGQLLAGMAGTAWALNLTDGEVACIAHTTDCLLQDMPHDVDLAGRPLPRTSSRYILLQACCASLVAIRDAARTDLTARDRKAEG